MHVGQLLSNQCEALVSLAYLRPLTPPIETDREPSFSVLCR
jgi:hypothetical protein